MATIARATFRPWVFQVHNRPTVNCRSYAAVTKQRVNVAQVPPKKPRTTSARVAAMLNKSKKSASSSREQQTTGEASKTDSPSSTADEELKQIEQLKKISDRLTRTDVWGSEVTSLDVEIPYDLRSMFKALIREPRFTKRKFRDLGSAMNHNFTNWAKNFISMLAMARANAFPGVDSSHLKLYRPSTLLRLVNVQSHSRASLLAPLKQISLQNYQTIYLAIARRKESAVKDLTCGEFQRGCIRTIRQRPTDHMVQWDIVSNISEEALFPKARRPSSSPPVTVVSVRAMEAYFAAEDPKLGNRLAVQALVKFDTSQLVKITDKEGRPVEKTAPEPSRVIQYLVLEKIGWYDSPWRVKEQVYMS